MVGSDVFPIENCTFVGCTIAAQESSEGLEIQWTIGARSTLRTLDSFIVWSINVSKEKNMKGIAIASMWRTVYLPTNLP